MPVTHIESDLDEATTTITAWFDAPVDRVWQVYADPRQLERIWGPPTFPATVIDHDLTNGGRVTYFMTGPEGEKYFGLWEVSQVVPTSHFSFIDGFAHDDFSLNTDMPISRNTYSFEAVDGGTRAIYKAWYGSSDELQSLLDMGMTEGASTAIDQIDVLLAG